MAYYFNKAAVTNGVPDCIFGTIDAGFSTYPFSFAFWFNCDNVIEELFPISLHNSAYGMGFSVAVLMGSTTGDPIEGRIYNTSNGAPSWPRSTGGYTSFAWHHFCAVFASTTSRRCYLNGVSGPHQTSSTDALPLNTMNELFIGGFQNGSNTYTYYRGHMAEIGVWKSTLTEDQVVSLAKGATPSQVSPSTLIVCAPTVRNLPDYKRGPMTNGGHGTVSKHCRRYG